MDQPLNAQTALPTSDPGIVPSEIADAAPPVTDASLPPAGATTAPQPPPQYDQAPTQSSTQTSYTGQPHVTNVYVTQQVQAPAMAAVYAGPPKSMAASVILTVLFGPLGLFYASTKFAVIMLIVSIAVALFTAGFGLLITYPICIILSITEVNKHNQMAAAGGGNVQIANAPRP